MNINFCSSYMSGMNVSLGGLEMAMDYLANPDLYEPELTEVKTTISKKPSTVVQVVKPVKPKISRENIINKFSIVQLKPQVTSDEYIDNTSLIDESVDFDFSFDDEIDKTSIEKEETVEIENISENDLIANELNQRIQQMSDDDFDFEDDNTEDEEDDPFDEIDDIEIEEDDDTDEEDEFPDIDDMDFEDDEEEDEDSDDITFEDDDITFEDDDIEIEDEEEDEDSDTSEATQNKKEFSNNNKIEDIEFEDDDEEESDDDDMFDINDIELDDEDDEEEEDNTPVEVKDIKTTEQVQQAVEVEKVDNAELNELKAELEKLKYERSIRDKEEKDRIQKEKEQNALNDKKQLQEELALVKKQSQSVKNASTPKNTSSVIEGNKNDLIDDLIGEQHTRKTVVNTHAKYDEMPVDKLYRVVKAYMIKAGVDKRPIDRTQLNERFGESNIKRLLQKTYLISKGKGVTVGL